MAVEEVDAFSYVALGKSAVYRGIVGKIVQRFEDKGLRLCGLKTASDDDDGIRMCLRGGRFEAVNRLAVAAEPGSIQGDFGEHVKVEERNQRQTWFKAEELILKQVRFYI